MPAQLDKHKATILAVDDNQDVREALSLLLENEGFTVQTAKDGQDALYQLRGDTHVSLVLLDLWMPVMDGWEFLRQKAEVTSAARIPVILLSAVPLSSPPEGADALLRKPVSLSSLLEEIQRQLRELRPNSRPGSRSG
jgi:CheY-like chemotaxis protein